MRNIFSFSFSGILFKFKKQNEQKEKKSHFKKQIVWKQLSVSLPNKCTFK